MVQQKLGLYELLLKPHLETNAAALMIHYTNHMLQLIYFPLTRVMFDFLAC